jgi:hypothetical protein
MEDKSSGDETRIQVLMNWCQRIRRRAPQKNRSAIKIVDRVKENVSVRITTSQACRMRFLEETGSNRSRLERNMTAHTPAELEAIYKINAEQFRNLEECDVEIHWTLGNHPATARQALASAGVQGDIWAQRKSDCSATITISPSASMLTPKGGEDSGILKWPNKHL